MAERLLALVQQGGLCDGIFRGLRPLALGWHDSGFRQDLDKTIHIILLSYILRSDSIADQVSNQVLERKAVELSRV